MKNPLLKSKEAKFLLAVFEAQDPPSHPLLKVLLGQLQKLSALIDEKESYQKTVRGIFNFIKENWN